MSHSTKPTKISKATAAATSSLQVISAVKEKSRVDKDNNNSSSNSSSSSSSSTKKKKTKKTDKVFDNDNNDDDEGEASLSPTKKAAQMKLKVSGILSVLDRLFPDPPVPLNRYTHTHTHTHTHTS